MSDPFEGGREVKPSRISFAKVGDYVIGYFNQSKIVQFENGATPVYELKGIAGQFHTSKNTTDENGNKVVTVDENPVNVDKGDYYTLIGGKESIDSMFKKARLGQKVGIKFESVKPSKKPGFSGFKVFAPFMWDEQDPEFMGQSAEDLVEEVGV